ncbi:hypothetical protein MGN70_000822 [Eutypa lata]|nr:hypothetical protein MGN70_000822 [Eutypa lata]
MGILSQMYMKYVNIPLPPAGTFKGQAVLITGGTSGLGLAAAAHFVNLGAQEVIITSRNAARASGALSTLERETQGRSKDVVRVETLDMTSYASVAALSAEIKKVRAGRGGIDHVILNAGTYGVDFTMAEEGWEQNILVNVLSTVLLGLLLIPWLKEERANRATPAHLSVVSSGQHVNPDIGTWATWIPEGVLQHFNKPENWPGPIPMYAATKLMDVYAFDELSKRALGPDGRPQVIVNTMCPGPVKTDLSRHFSEKYAAFVVVRTIFTGLFAKSSADGARTYVAVGLTKEDEHGKFVQFYQPEGDYKKAARTNIMSAAGREMQSQIWTEITTELSAKVPEVKDILG